MLKKQLNKKDMVNFKIFDVAAWLRILTILILPNISRSKGNQTLKFGQVIEYNKRIIFLRKSYRK